MLKFSMMVTLERGCRENLFSFPYKNKNKTGLIQRSGVGVILNFSTVARNYKIIKQFLQISEGK